jgi:hypothetical protein
MKQVTNAPHEFYINGVQIEKIIFDDTDFVSVQVKARLNQNLQHLHLLLTIDKFNDWMRFNGNKGEQIILAMVDAMMAANQPPYVLHIKEMLGNQTAFTTCKLSLQKIEDTNTIASCFIVYDIHPINIIQQGKNLTQHLKDFGTVEVNNAHLLHNGFTQLSEQYKYYLGLLELDIKESAARHKSALIDDRLFAMAKSAYQQQL